MITVHSIGEEIRLNNERQLVPGMIKGGQMFYLVDNMWVDGDVFNILYPPVQYVPDNIKGQNADRTKAWLQNKKSY